LVPEEIARDIEKTELKFSPIRDLVQVRQVGTSDFKMIVNEGGATAEWVTESSSRSDQSTPTLRERVPVQAELSAAVVATNWLIDDSFFNVRDFLVSEVAEAFAVKEELAVISGSGSGQPKGMLQESPTSRDDFDSPLRDPDVYQYVDDGDSPFAVNYDSLTNLIYKVNAK